MFLAHSYMEGMLNKKFKLIVSVVAFVFGLIFVNFTLLFKLGLLLMIGGLFFLLDCIYGIVKKIPVLWNKSSIIKKWSLGFALFYVVFILIFIVPYTKGPVEVISFYYLAILPMNIVCVFLLAFIGDALGTNITSFLYQSKFYYYFLGFISVAFYFLVGTVFGSVHSFFLKICSKLK